MILGKKTKIVCTMGPASESPAKLTELVNAGMNVMRLNFSHGSFDEHQKRVDAIREIMPKIKRRCAGWNRAHAKSIRTGLHTLQALSTPRMFISSRTATVPLI